MSLCQFLLKNVTFIQLFDLEIEPTIQKYQTQRDGHKTWGCVITNVNWSIIAAADTGNVPCAYY